MLSTFSTATTEVSSLQNKLSVTHSIRLNSQAILVQKTDTVTEFDVYQLFKLSNLFTIVTAELMPVNPQLVSAKLRVQLQLTQDYAKHFTLLNGLLSFGKTPGTLIEIQKATRSIVVTLAVENNKDVAAYFNNVLQLFQKELIFKKSLRIILAAERKMKEDLGLLYNKHFA